MNRVRNPSVVLPAWIARLEHLDRRLCRQVNQLGVWPHIRQPFCWISRLGDGLVWYSVMLVLPLMYGVTGLWLSLQLVLTGLLGTWVYLLLKKGTGRLRPCDAWQDIQARLPPLDRFSFPSGHTLHAVAFSALLVHAFPALMPLLLGFSLLVALSRLVLGLHYPTDVLAGALLGWGMAELSLAVHQPLL
jgi:undecaprenyl-diphosphatase